MTRNVSINVGLAMVVVLSVLAAAGPPAQAGNVATSAAADGLVVGSQHTTDSDFQAGTLTNMSVVGSGDDATVELESGTSTTVYDDFDDGDISEYSGETGSATVQSSTAVSGSALNLSTTGGDNPDLFSTSGLNAYPERGETFSFRANLDTDRIRGRYYFGLQGGESFGDGTYRVLLDDNQNQLALGVSDSSGSGTTLDTDSIDFPNDQFLYVEVDYGDTVQDEIEVTVYDDDPDDGGSQLAQVFVDESADSVSASWDSGGIGWTTFGPVAGNIYYDENLAAETEASVSGQYVSDTHQVSNAEEATVNITEFSDVSASLAVEYNDGSSWQQANTTSISGTGNYTLTLPDVSSSDWRVSVSYDKDGSSPQFAVADDSILFTPHAPAASNATPSDNTTLSDSEATLSVDVSDADFATAQGDSLDVSFVVDGQEVSTETLTSNGTASTTVTRLGETDWHAVIEDEWGQTTTTPTRTFRMPNELRVLKELNPQELIDGNVNLTVRAYAGDTAISREVTDGTVSLSGFPVDQAVVITATGDNYVDRRIIIKDITEQQRIYLLNSSAETVPVTFQLSDKTGRFPPESSQLYIQKALNVSGAEDLQWQTITGDNFAADLRFPTTLAESQRYRIVIENDQGDRRVLGSYIPYEPTTTTLSIGEIVWDIPETHGVYSTSRITDDGQLRVLYNDTAGATTSLNVTAWNRTSGERIYHAVDTDVQQSVVAVPVNSSDIVVNVTALRDGEPDYTWEGAVGRPDADQGLGFDKWLRLGAQVLMAATAGLVVGYMPKKGGLIVVPLAFGVTWFGIWSIHPASLSIMGAIAIMAATNREGY